MKPIWVDLKVLDYAADLYPNGAVPAKGTTGAAAVDLLAADDAVIGPGDTVPIRTGLRMHMRYPDMCAIVVPRSGLGAKEGVVLGNTLGLIDPDYQGDITCYVFNRNPSVRSKFAGGNALLEAIYPKMVRIQRGMRFAQMFFVPFLSVQFNRVDEFAELTQRGEGGFGHTGV